jgi:phasin family protein
MTFNTQEFSALGQAQLEKNTRLASIWLNGAQRMAALQFEFAFKQLNGHAQAFKSLTQLKDPKALFDFQASLAQPAIDQAYSAACNAYETAAATQQELTAFVEEQFAEGNKTFINSLDKLTKHAPAGSEIVVNAFKSAVNQSSTAFESASKVAKQAGEQIAQAGVQAVTQAAQAASAAVTQKKSS